MDKPKPLSGTLSLIAAVMAANAAKTKMARVAAGTKRARQFTESKGTGQKQEIGYLPSRTAHIGKKQIAKELKKLEKKRNKNN